MESFSWPKPSLFPWCSVTLALLNAGVYYGLAVLLGSSELPHWAGAAIWTAPAWTLNLFFFWSEYDDYRRERRNYEGWKAEMRHLLGEDLPKSWHQRVDQLRKPKNNV